MADPPRSTSSLEPIKQGAAPHGQVQLGGGRRTIAQAGCLLACFVMCARQHFPQKNLSLLDAHAHLCEKNAFEGSALRRVTAARVLGLDVRFWDRGLHLKNLLATVNEGNPAILGIDYKAGRSSARSAADHFVLCIGATEGAITYIDPATGTIEQLDVRKPTYRARPCSVAETMLLGPAGI